MARVARVVKKGGRGNRRSIRITRFGEFFQRYRGGRWAGHGDQGGFRGRINFNQGSYGYQKQQELTGR